MLYTCLRAVAPVNVGELSVTSDLNAGGLVAGRRDVVALWSHFGVIMTHHRTLRMGCQSSLLAITWAAFGSAAPVLRNQVDLHGDFVLFGNTLGWDCGAGAPAPTVGTTSCAGVNNGNDSGIDILWRSDDTAAQPTAAANRTITVANARSTAMLALPTPYKISYARLYWGAHMPAPPNGSTPADQADKAVLIERPGTAYTKNVTADSMWTAVVPAANGEFWYQGSADITDLVTLAGAGAYRVSGVNTDTDLTTLDNEVTYAGWAVVVFYEHDGDTPRNLALFDGLDPVGQGQSFASTLTGFLVPQVGFTAKLGVLAYEGDYQFTGDSSRSMALS